MKLAWNAIVKDEAAVIERCVSSLLPHIDCAVVVDTGSTDGTPDLLERLFDQAGKSLEIHRASFVNFETSRNLALLYARTSDLDWDYLLLADADMEFRVKQQPWFYPNGGLAYDMRQVGGALGYYNRRLVSRKADGWYVGVTHEYLDIPASGIITSADFVDHADGHNRPDKCVRDIALLEQALATETRSGLIERYTFYLANSYFELGSWETAIDYYKKRVALGGFDEERWYAQMRLAQCRGNMGDQAGFLLEMFRAYKMRPHRAEVLYELAKDFRVRGENESSLLFSEAGMQVSYPASDVLFVNDWVYKSGLMEEFAICAYYDPRRRSRGFKECDKLALAGSDQARSNLYWYLKPLSEDVPSFKPQQIQFDPPSGYVACNPSVVNHDGQPVILVRTVNYTINGEGGYDIRDGDGACSDRNPIHTRNFLVHPQSTLAPRELQLPRNWPNPQYHLVRGFEDSRLFEWNEVLRTISTVRELTPEGWCEQVFDTITDHGYDVLWRQILPKERRHEKNWMPWVRGDNLWFVYRLGTIIDRHGEVIFESDPGFDVSNISGGSQVVQVDERTWLAVVHEARAIPGDNRRFYQHRFVAFWANGRVDRISAPFFFHDRQIEFCAGLAVFGKQLMVSYGVRDCEAWTATMNTDEVLRFIYKGTP
jgi:glycosyltransferase involved in cell wall biosynthesis